MADMMSKHAFGKREGIEAAKLAGNLDEYDVLFLDNGETGWIDRNGNTVISTPRTQKAVTVNGATAFGVADGTTIPAGKTIDEIVKMLAQKSIPAEYIQPTVQLTNQGSTDFGDVEAGTTITPKLQASFTKHDAGDLTKLSILMDETEVISSTETVLSYEGGSIAIGDENVAFKAQAMYDEGQVKADNLGEESPTGHIEAGTITSQNFSFTGRRRAFYGSGTGTLSTLTSDLIRGLNNSVLNPQSKQFITMTAAKGCQYIVFAVPSTLKLAQISYDDMGDKSMLNSFSQDTVQVADARGGANGLKDYTCYSYKLKTPAVVPLTFTFTIA